MLKQTFSQVILGIDLPIVQPTAYSGKALQSLRRVKLKNFFIAKEITAGGKPALSLEREGAA